jgi:hypothetical protein
MTELSRIIIEGDALIWNWRFEANEIRYRVGTLNPSFESHYRAE